MANPFIVDPARAGAEKQIEIEYVDDRGDASVVRKLWIKVKNQLSIGEHRRMMRQVSSISQPVQVSGDDQKGAEARFEWTDYSFARMGAYITDWSLAHEAERADRLAPTRASYEKLTPEVFELIDTALDDHEKAATEEKKARAGRRQPSETPA